MVFKLSNLRTMTVKADLPEIQFGKKITNTSVRKRLCQKLLESDIPDTHAVHVTGHKSASSLNNYRSLSNAQQKSISNLLAAPPATVSTHISQATLCTNSTITNNNGTQSAFVSLPGNWAFSLFSNTTITGGTFNITLQHPNMN
jgi:hypothetical protein